MSGGTKIPKDIRPLVDAATAAGWTVHRAKNHHLRFFRPDGSFVIAASSTAYSGTVIARLRSKLRNAGLDI